jgi:hypothetical protein
VLLLNEQQIRACVPLDARALEAIGQAFVCELETDEAGYRMLKVGD